MNETYNIQVTRTESGYIATVKELELVAHGATWQEALHAIEQAIVSRQYEIFMAHTGRAQQASHL